ncbi:MAG: GNAT family N-acetyltransferase [Herpetosiphonaceae bacterium]|nr:GNAT family N-acetyltransferase [Herpetosiphonaceae bacterium]
MLDLSQVDSTIHVLEAPAIAGLTFRHYRGPEDFAVIASIFNAAARADAINEVATTEMILEQYTHLNNCDLAQDLVLVEVAGVPVAYTRVEWWDEAAGNRIYVSFGHVVPEWRRRGIGGALLSHNQRRMRHIASEHVSDLPCFFQGYAAATALGNAALLKREGYQAVRHGFDMERDLAEPIGSTVLPAGLEVRTPTPAQYRQVWEADGEAFRDHWGFRQPSENDYQNWLKWPYFAPQIWQVAWEGDQVAGMVLNFIDTEANTANNLRRGYTEGISVRRPWRKRGLATALINRSLTMFRDMGMTEAALGVDAENLSGALRVYEGCGFKVVKRSSTYRKAL